MKDDNILLEALKEIARKNPYGWTLHNGEMCNRIAIDAITKYNQSPSDESKEIKELTEMSDEEFESNVNNAAKILGRKPESNQDELLESLPEFLYTNDGEIFIGYHGDTNVTSEYKEWLDKLKSQYKITKR